MNISLEEQIEYQRIQCEIIMSDEKSRNHYLYRKAILATLEAVRDERTAKVMP